MRLYEMCDRSTQQLTQLLEVWESSIRATHLFLSGAEIQAIKASVPQALRNVKHLIAVENAHNEPIAFLGAENGRLEMLFITPSERGKGLGRQLLQYGIENYGIREVTVNEQNPQAVGFYAHMGFRPYKRTDRDEEGGPYPLLYMKRP